MKRLIILIIINFALLPTKAQHPVFVRIYNLDGKKLNKGSVITVSDSALQLKSGNDTITILIKDISIIKTKNSGWHNVLVGSCIGIVGGAVLGLINPPTKTKGGIFTWAGSSATDELAIGTFLGSQFGASLGGISALFKNSKTFVNNGDINNWKKFEAYITQRR